MNVQEILRRAHNAIATMAVEASSKVHIPELDRSAPDRAPHLPLTHDTLGARHALHYLNKVEPHLEQRAFEINTIRRDLEDALMREGSPITPIDPGEP